MALAGVTFKIPERYVFQGKRLEGGQGFVYVYKDSFLDRLVAIKEMKRVRNSHSLRNELAKIREIRSRHVIEVYDFFEAKHSERVALVEEYVGGPTIQELAGSLVAPIDGIKVLWQIACGLADIHSHGIIHRDVKPSNMRFDRENIVKIFDFGLSSLTAGDPHTLSARGTTNFLAPEMYGTPPIRLRPAMDVYAFGVTAWYFLGKGSLPRALKERPPQSETEVPSLKGAQLRLPVSITKVLDSAINPDPLRRPQMSSIRDVLERELTKEQHRLVFIYEGQRQVLSREVRSVKLTVGDSSLTIVYDGFKFDVESFNGQVYLNNTRIKGGDAVPDACVVTFGNASEGADRTFVPMTVLTPEVVL